MSEAEEATTVEETGSVEAVKEEAEEVEEVIDIDINASLLETMVKRTEILEKLLHGELSLEEATASLEAIKLPMQSQKRRRRKK